METSTALLTARKPFAGIGRHISHSQVSLFDKCTLAWYLKYVRGIEKPPTVHVLLGQCYHSALALNFRQKTVTGDDLPVDEVISHFSRSFEDAVADGNIDIAPGVSPHPYRGPVERVLSHYYLDYVVGRMEPILVEHEMVCSIPGCDRLFAGIMDVQLSDGVMIDFKVTARRWTDSDIASNHQATAYAMLYGHDTDFEFHIGLRANATPAVQIVRTRRTRDDVSEYADHLNQLCASMTDIEEGRVDPLPRTGYCSEKTCQYYQECCDHKYGGGP